MQIWFKWSLKPSSNRPKNILDIFKFSQLMMISPKESSDVTCLNMRNSFDGIQEIMTMTPSCALKIVIFGLIGLLLVLIPYISPAHGQFINFTLDFENENLQGWSKEDVSIPQSSSYTNPFNFQPTFVDNPKARDPNRSSNLSDNYRIGTYEKLQNLPRLKPGDVKLRQADVPQGILISSVFTIPTGTLSFLIRGGNKNETRVELQVLRSDGWQTIFAASGKNSETMERISPWDLGTYAGEKGRLRIQDLASGTWGHINVDDFRFQVIVPNVREKTWQQAQADLAEQQLLAKASDENFNYNDRDLVADQNPPQDAKVNALSPVYLTRKENEPDATILPPTETEMVVVPDVRGMTWTQAQAILAENKLQAGTMGQRIDLNNAQVVDQSLMAESVVEKQSVVYLTLSALERQVIPKTKTRDELDWTTIFVVIIGLSGIAFIIFKRLLGPIRTEQGPKRGEVPKNKPERGNGGPEDSREGGYDQEDRQSQDKPKINMTETVWKIEPKKHDGNQESHNGKPPRLDLEVALTPVLDMGNQELSMSDLILKEWEKDGYE
jgi:hypothetical protein